MPAQQDTFIRRFIRWRFLIIVNVIVVVLLSMSLGREVVRSRSIGSEIASLQAQADELAARNIEISEIKTAMQTESYIEREARLKLGLKKPGETVVVIQEPDHVQEMALDGDVDASDPLGLVLEPDTPEQVANPARWWYYFFNKPFYNAIVEYER